MSSSGHYHKWTNLLVDQFNYSNNRPFSTKLTVLKSPSLTSFGNYTSLIQHHSNSQYQHLLNYYMPKQYQRQICSLSNKQSQSIENFNYQYSINQRPSYNRVYDYCENKYNSLIDDCQVMHKLKKKKCSVNRQPLKQTMINRDLFSSKRSITSPPQKQLKKINSSIPVQIIQPILPMKTIIHYLPIYPIQRQPISYYPLPKSINIHQGHIYDENTFNQFQLKQNVITQVCKHKKAGISISLKKSGDKIVRIQQSCQQGKTKSKYIKQNSIFSPKKLDVKQQLDNKMWMPTLKKQEGLNRK